MNLLVEIGQRGLSVLAIRSRIARKATVIAGHFSGGSSIPTFASNPQVHLLGRGTVRIFRNAFEANGSRLRALLELRISLQRTARIIRPLSLRTFSSPCVVFWSPDHDAMQFFAGLEIPTGSG
jgi:hypothetical protein